MKFLNPGQASVSRDIFCKNWKTLACPVLFELDTSNNLFDCWQDYTLALITPPRTASNSAATGLASKTLSFITNHAEYR